MTSIKLVFKYSIESLRTFLSSSTQKITIDANLPDHSARHRTDPPGPTHVTGNYVTHIYSPSRVIDSSLFFSIEHRQKLNFEITIPLYQINYLIHFALNCQNPLSFRCTCSFPFLYFINSLHTWWKCEWLHLSLLIGRCWNGVKSFFSKKQNWNLIIDIKLQRLSNYNNY